MSMNQKVGIEESGIASAETKVARQSRRKKNTTITASTAPSIIDAIELSYCTLTSSTSVASRVNWTAPPVSLEILSSTRRVSS